MFINATVNFKIVLLYNICNNKSFIEINDDVNKNKVLYKIVVPMSLCLPLYEKIHTEFGHPRIYTMINLIAPKYYLPHINNDIQNYAKHCHICQINNNCKQKRLGLLLLVLQLMNPFEMMLVIR